VRVTAEMRWQKPEQSRFRLFHRRMQPELPILFTKRGCPWCREVIEFLDRNGVGYRLRDVTDDPTALEEMRRASGQTRAPTLDWQGEVLADFGVDELVPFLRLHNVTLEDS
jgi:glutaredoxin 3